MGASQRWPAAKPSVIPSMHNDAGLFQFDDDDDDTAFAGNRLVSGIDDVIWIFLCYKSISLSNNT